MLLLRAALSPFCQLFQSAMKIAEDFIVRAARTIDMVNAVYVHFASIYSPRPAD